jgi:alkyl sulfatase BDS1-like metallo-beta-lactamase superfamily hydrolase
LVNIKKRICDLKPRRELHAQFFTYNLLPFRGADVRDALAWSKYLNEALLM